MRLYIWLAHRAAVAEIQDQNTCKKKTLLRTKVSEREVDLFSAKEKHRLDRIGVVKSQSVHIIVAPAVRIQVQVSLQPRGFLPRHQKRELLNTSHLRREHHIRPAAQIPFGRPVDRRDHEALSRITSATAKRSPPGISVTELIQPKR